MANKIVDGVVLPLTEEEEAERAAKEAAYLANADDRAAEEVRAKRDKLLSHSDWRASTDVTLSAEWTTYRQALRDITAQDGFPNEITWPTAP